MQMLDRVRSLAEDGDRAYRVAGLVYGVLGIAIMAITVASPALLRPERRADLVHLLVGLPFFVLFALAVAYGDRPVAALARRVPPIRHRAAAIGWWFREKLVLILTLSGLGRTAVFAGNALGRRLVVTRSPFGVSLESASPEPRMWLNAALMTVIVVFLARAAWVPFLRRLRVG